MFVILILFVSFVTITRGQDDDDNDGIIYRHDCICLSDGSYTFDSLSPRPLVNLDSSNEYIILNIFQDINLKEYFTSFEKWHEAIGGSSKSDAVN